MTTIQVHFDDATYERIRRLAEAAGLTPDAYVARCAKNAAPLPPPPPPVEIGAPANDAASVIGMWADESEAVDRMLHDVTEWRRARNQALMRKADESGRLDDHGDET